jgi:hypothetical protein
MTAPGWINRKNIYFFGLALMVISLPTSKFLMSIAQFTMIFNWLLDRNVISKFRRFFSDRAAMAVVSIFFIHVIGVLWSSDLNYASKDLRIKLPLLALPVIIATSPKLKKMEFYHLIVLFIAANVFSSMLGVVKLITRDVTEIRDISVFISHIRFALMIALAVFSGCYLFFKNDYTSKPVRWLILLASIWLLFYLLIMESATGLGVMFITTLIVLLLYVFHQKRLFPKLVAAMLLIGLPAFMFLVMRSLYLEIVPKEPFYHDNLEEFTEKGNPYTHDSRLIGFENGNWVGQYIQMEEIRSEWEKRSAMPFDSLDRSGQSLRFTLIRFLTSKGLRKDADGVRSLTQEDITAIEKGVATINDLREGSMISRIKTLIWEVEIYRQTGYIKNLTLMQRLEFWRAGIRIISQNVLFGVGTGDIDNAFKEMYKEMETVLPQNQWWRTHNQYLTVFATLGIF